MGFLKWCNIIEVCCVTLEVFRMFWKAECLRQTPSNCFVYFDSAQRYVGKILIKLILSALYCNFGLEENLNMTITGFRIK